MSYFFTCKELFKVLIFILKEPKRQGIISIRMYATVLKSQATEAPFIKVLSDIASTRRQRTLQWQEKVVQCAASAMCDSAIVGVSLLIDTITQMSNRLQ